MTGGPNTNLRARAAREKLEARRGRISLIRRRVATATLAAFALTACGLLYQDITAPNSDATATSSGSGSSGGEADGQQISLPSIPLITSQS
jgi:hypothetical protein